MTFNICNWRRKESRKEGREGGRETGREGEREEGRKEGTHIYAYIRNAREISIWLPSLWKPY